MIINPEQTQSKGIVKSHDRVCIRHKGDRNEGK